MQPHNRVQNKLDFLHLHLLLLHAIEQLHEIISMHAFGMDSLSYIRSSFCLLQSKVSSKGRTGVDICLPPDRSLVMDPLMW